MPIAVDHLPLCVKLRRGENRGCDASTVDWRVGIHGSDNDLDLTVHSSLLFRRGRDEGKRAYAFTVEAHVLIRCYPQINLATDSLPWQMTGKGQLDAPAQRNSALRRRPLWYPQRRILDMPCRRKGTVIATMCMSRYLS
jgi:hypothetical protein